MFDADLFDSSLFDGTATAGPGPTALVLTQPFYCTLLSPDDDPFAIDADQTVLITTLDDDPFGIDPELTTK